MSLTILLHSSKTMVLTPTNHVSTHPRFLKEAELLHQYIKGLTSDQLQKSMHLSESLALKVIDTYRDWRAAPSLSAAVETFRGDIYSGLRALDFTDEERVFAQQHLHILSGMYGLLRPYDDVYPYRLEAGYVFPDTPYNNMYRFWGQTIADELPQNGQIINLTSAEYDKLVLPYIDSDRLITPKFLSIVPGQTQPKFVAVHAKIARGAYARWLIQRGRDVANALDDFNDLGYEYDAVQSTERNPVYICKDFKGIGLSQRLI